MMVLAPRRFTESLASSLV